MTILDEHTSRHASLVNQEVLERARIAIIGSNDFADMVVLTAAGLGIGTIYHKENHEEGFLSRLAFAENKSRMEKIEDLNILQEHIIFNETLPRGIDYVVSCDKEYTLPKEAASNPLSTMHFREAYQAGIFAGMIGQDIVSALHSQERNHFLSQLSKKVSDAKDLRAIVIGAGATGTHVALAANLANFSQIDIMDGDVIEASNLNRQSFYYDNEGLPKARILSEHLQKLGSSSSSYETFLSAENTSLLENYDVLFSCVDLYTPRRILDTFATQNSVVLVDGGTGANGGRSAMYIPQKTLPIHEQIELHIQDPEPKTGCSYSPTPSIIMPNTVIGSLMVHQSLCEPSSKILRYDRECNKVYSISSFTGGKKNGA